MTLNTVIDRLDGILNLPATVIYEAAQAAVNAQSLDQHLSADQIAAIVDVLGYWISCNARAACGLTA